MGAICHDSVAGSTTLDYGRHAHAAADTQSRQAIPILALLHLMEQRDQNTRS
jgi:hypothetical protein